MNHLLAVFLEGILSGGLIAAETGSTAFFCYVSNQIRFLQWMPPTTVRLPQIRLSAFLHALAYVLSLCSPFEVLEVVICRVIIQVYCDHSTRSGRHESLEHGTMKIGRASGRERV